MANLRRRKGMTDDEQFLAPPKLEYSLASREAWRVFRIMGEFVEGFEALAELGPAVTIFGSARARPGDGSGWYEKATAVARHLGEHGFNIITGGGPGIMEAANKGAHEAGVTSVGLNIELPFEQHVNPYVDISVDFRYFFARKTMLVKYSQAFVVMPGGFGTMDETFEALTLIQTGKIHNFPVVLFGTSYWGGLIDWMRHTMLPNGMVSEEDINLLIVTDSADIACEHILLCLEENPKRQQVEADARAVTERVIGRRRNGS